MKFPFRLSLSEPTQHREAGEPGQILYVPGLPSWLPDPRTSPFELEIDEDADGQYADLRMKARTVAGSFRMHKQFLDQEKIELVVDQMTSELKNKLIEDFGLQGELDRRIRQDHKTDLDALYKELNGMRDLGDVRVWLIERLAR